jgi:CRP-like cAMP-binding protein
MEESEIQRYVREHPFFDDMSPDHCAVASKCTRLVHIPMGHHVFRHCEPASEFYLLRQGRVGLRSSTAKVTFLTLGEDEFLGASWAASHRRWTCDAIALEFVSALAVDVARLQDEWESGHDFGFACLRRILPIFQSRLDNTRLQSLNVYG